MKRPGPCGVLAGFVAVAPALADNSFLFDVSNSVSPNHPTATIEVWAHFDVDQYAFAGALWDVSASSDPGGFSDPFTVLRSIGTADGEVAPDGDSVGHIIAGQPHFPILGYNADTSNPILVWRATWSTDDFTPRTVDLATFTSKFHLYLDESGLSEEFLHGDFVEGAGSIQVVPAPGSLWAGAALAACALVRRRRGRTSGD